MPAGAVAALGTHAWAWARTGHRQRPRQAIGPRASRGQAALTHPAEPGSLGTTPKAHHLSSTLGAGFKAIVTRSSSWSKGRRVPGARWDSGHSEAPFLPSPQVVSLVATILPPPLLSYQQLSLAAAGSSALVPPLPVQSLASNKEGHGGLGAPKRRDGVSGTSGLSGSRPATFVTPGFWESNSALLSYRVVVDP